MKKFKSAATAFFITAGLFCGLICLVGTLLLPARVGSGEAPAGEDVSGIGYSLAPDPISIKVTSEDGGALLYLTFSLPSLEIYLFEEAEDLDPAETDYFIELGPGFLRRFCDRIGGIDIDLTGRKETFFGPALEQFASEERDVYKMRKISSAFFEKISKTGLSSEDFMFIIEDGETDLNFPTCYDMGKYIPEVFANCYYR